jgi:predicted nucleotidyltransferase
MTPDLPSLNADAERRGLPFLIVGGYAVNAHGYSRKTFDIDLMIRRDDSSAWREVMAGIGYRCTHEQTSFLQFAAADMPQIDLLRVNEETFTQLLAASERRRIAGIEARVPSLEHLIALKLHAAKNAPSHRRYKDLIDIFYLVDVNKVDVSTDQFRQLCCKYGTAELYDEIRKTRK